MILGHIREVTALPPVAVSSLAGCLLVSPPSEQNSRLGSAAEKWGFTITTTSSNDSIPGV